jgi:hypothetical protein
MNTSRLLELIGSLLDVESGLSIQKALQQLNQHLGNLMQNTSDANLQNAVATTLDNLRTIVTQLKSRFNPSQVTAMMEIGAADFFVTDFMAEIDGWIQKNPMTPAVTKKNLDTFITNRQKYLTQLSAIRDNMNAIGLAPSAGTPGAAEVGFLVPRSFFKNQLDLMVKELSTTNHIIRIFSEVVSDGGAEQVEVREISTTDPQFFFGLSPVTVAAIGFAAKWAIDLWGEVEKIRKVRAETRQLKIHTEKELQALFDDKIKDKFAEAIRGEVERLLGPENSQPGRRTELRNGLAWALESLIARIERGIQIDVRSVPPTAPSPEEQRDPKVGQAFTELEEIKRKLAYPESEDQPVMKLPSPEPPAA